MTPHRCGGLSGARYTVNVHRDLRPRRLRPWWATITVGIGIPEDGTRSARSREALVAKCRRYAARDALRRGMAGEPVVTIREATP